MSLNLNEEMARVDKRLVEREETLGKGLNQPFNITNSGSRKIMFGTHQEHRLPLLEAEPALVSTGYENMFGEYSSAFHVMDKSKTVIAKIPKFSWNPNHHYFMIVVDEESRIADVIERISYKHITESYGYLIDNTYLDNLEVGNEIKTGTVFQKSQSFDDFNNRKDGLNLVTAYLACDGTMEDGIIISESAADKLVSPLIRKAEIIINDNDIMLNIHGDENNYKVIPDIGESNVDVLCALRRENKEDIFYTQSFDMLRKILMSDTIYTVAGEVVDIDIYCNNPANLKGSKYNAQLLKYYEETQRFSREIVETLNGIKANGYDLGYDAQKLYVNCNRQISGAQYIKDRPFSNIIMNVYLLDRNKISTGDKLSDRYGGKGVVSAIVPDELMPRTEDGTVVELIHNSSTCVGRENPGQLFELSTTHIGEAIQKFIRIGALDLDQSIELYTKYLSILSPELGEYTEHMLSHMSEDDRQIYMNEISSDNGIMVCMKPITESMTLDKLAELYEEFPWAKQNYIYSAVHGSNGEIRYVKSNRPIVIGKKYIYRLKQYAEEKFSVTSLSATNIKNENSRSKANKSYRAHYAKTPIKFGEMESGDMAHLGMEVVVTNLMIHSASPHARRLTEQLLTGDPFKIDIKLDETASNRGVEILNAYLKAMGIRLVFTKIPKAKKPMILYKGFEPIFLEGKDRPKHQMCRFEPEGSSLQPDYIERLLKYEDGKKLEPMILRPMIEYVFTDDDENAKKAYQKAQSKYKY